MSKIALITGPTSGIGRATVFELAQYSDIELVLPVRNIEKGHQLVRELKEKIPQCRTNLVFCDLASLESIREFVVMFKYRYNQLDILINNAGIWPLKRELSRDGIEMVFAVNYLAMVYLTTLLEAELKIAPAARIINISSGLHTGTINFADIEFEKNFSGFKAYRQSKLAVILFTRLLAEKWGEYGITVNCVQPGMVRTHLDRDSKWFVSLIFKLFGKSSKQGAQTSVYLATSNHVDGITGEYFAKKQIKRSSLESQDMTLAQKLWEVTEGYLGEV